MFGAICKEMVPRFQGHMELIKETRTNGDGYIITNLDFHHHESLWLVTFFDISFEFFIQNKNE